MDKKQVIKTTVTFGVLLAAGVGLAVSARQLPDLFEQIVMVGMGSALVGGALAFYLNQIAQWRPTAGK